MEDYYLQGNLLYHLGKLCVPISERVHVIREAHSSLVSGHFWVGKTSANLQRLLYWPRMKDIVTKYVKGCVMCSTSEPTKRKFGLYSLSPRYHCIIGLYHVVLGEKNFIVIF